MTNLKFSVEFRKSLVIMPTNAIIGIMKEKKQTLLTKKKKKKKMFLCLLSKIKTLVVLLLGFLKPVHRITCVREIFFSPSQMNEIMTTSHLLIHKKIPMNGNGKIILQMKDAKTCSIINVCYALDMKNNILNLGQLLEKGFDIHMKIFF